jgi:hypothetical protein
LRVASCVCVCVCVCVALLVLVWAEVGGGLVGFGFASVSLSVQAKWREFESLDRFFKMRHIQEYELVSSVERELQHFFTFFARGLSVSDKTLHYRANGGSISVHNSGSSRPFRTIFRPKESSNWGSKYCGLFSIFIFFL